MDKIFLPGNMIVGRTTFSNSDWIYGMILPEDVFMYEFAGEKGGYPALHLYDRETEKKYGNELPFQLNQETELGIPNPQGRILPLHPFITSSERIGIRVLGKVLSTALERDLGYEVCNTKRLGCYDIRGLSEGISVLSALVGSQSLNDCVLGDDIRTIREYFSGNFRGKTIDEMAGTEKSARRADLVRVLRQCEFPQSYSGLKKKREYGPRYVSPSDPVWI